jgi:tRNA threonylcarbamoyl adenosine modification protein YeaZ
MQILGIDSSTKNLSVGFSQDDTGYFGVNFSKETGFMVNIISCIDKVIKKAGKSISDVDAFSVNIGPGDFTGTRIGISVAKTLALVTGKPIYGIRALDICAAGLLLNGAAKISRLLQKKESVFLLPVLDVKRNEVFFSIYEASFEGDNNSSFTHKFGENNIFVSKVSGDHLVDCESFSIELDKIFLSEPIIVTVGRKPAVFVSGTGFLNYKHLFKDISKINYGFYLDSKSFYPDARFLNMCSHFRAVGEIKNPGLNTMAGSMQASGQMDLQAGKNRDSQTLETAQSGQTESAQTTQSGQTESTQAIKPGQPNQSGHKAEKPMFTGDKNVVPLYVRDFVPFIKKQDI